MDEFYLTTEELYHKLFPEKDQVSPWAKRWALGLKAKRRLDILE